MPNVTLPINLITQPPNQTLHAVPNGTFSTSDPIEGLGAYHTDWNNGSMNGFLNGSGPVSLQYYTIAQMGLEWYLAHQYAMGDMYFSSTLSETLPNILYSLAGFSPVTQDQISPPPFVTYNQTIFNEMDQNQVSWGYYFQNQYLGYYPLYYIYGMTSHFLTCTPGETSPMQLNPTALHLYLGFRQFLDLPTVTASNHRIMSFQERSGFFTWFTS